MTSFHCVIPILGIIFGVMFLLYVITNKYRMCNAAYKETYKESAPKKRKQNNKTKHNKRKKKKRKKERPRVTRKWVIKYNPPCTYQPKKKKKKKKSKLPNDKIHFNTNCSMNWGESVKCMQCNNTKCCPNCYAVDINWTHRYGRRKLVCRKCIKTFEQNRIYTSINRCCNIFKNTPQIIKTIVDYSVGYVHKCDNKNCNFERFMPTSFEAKSNRFEIYRCQQLCDNTYCQQCYAQTMYLGTCNMCIKKNDFRKFKDVFTDIKWISDIISNKMNITKLIFEYWMGYVLYCANGTKCNQEITVENQVHFKCLSGYYHRNIAGRFCYEIKEKYVNQHNRQYLVKVYGKYIRVLCNKCVQNCRKGCNVCLRNRDPQFKSCLNHPSCKLCKRRGKISLYKCYNCKNKCCSLCREYVTIRGETGEKKKYWCKNCIINKEYTMINKAILDGIHCNTYLRNKLDVNIAVLIAQYSYGIVIQCMAVSCDGEIAMDSIFQLKKQYKYSYKIKRKRIVNHLDTVLLFGENRRIFCKTCVKTKQVQICKLCNNFDEEKICGIHKLCALCNNPMNMNNIECELCDKPFCNKCSFGNETCTCLKCGKNELLYNLLQPYIIYDDIMDVLIEYMDYDIRIVIPQQKPKKKRKRKKRKHDYHNANNNLSDSRYSSVLMNENLMDYGYIQKFYGRI